MNKKGFALLELFAIISLLSLVAIVAIPQIINTAQTDKQNRFKTAVLETFTAALTRIDENINLSKDAGSWSCKDFKYDNDYPFKSCLITWDKKNPSIIDLKIDVISSSNETWTYKAKTKAQVEDNKLAF